MEPSSDKVRCQICPHACSLAEGQRGICKARYAHEGQVVCENYGRLTSLALDPIEKKPLARFHPGTTVLSLGSYGCNMHCPFCQNASIARVGGEETVWRRFEPHDIVAEAKRLSSEGCIGIAYTYNEPLISYEFVLDTARAARDAGLLNVVVSNGCICAEPLERLLPLIDAANIDLKTYSQASYRRLGGNLEATKQCIERMAQAPRCHVEVTTLVVPGISDDESEMEAMSAWLGSLDRSIPYHLTRFFPCYEMANAKPTPLVTLTKLASVANRHLDDVMLGNC